MARFHLFVCSLLILITSQSVSGQTLHTLTLEDAIAIAREQSPDALNSKQQFRISYWDYRSFRATYLPSLAISAGPEYSQGFTSNFNSISQTQEYYFQQLLATQGTLSLSQRIGPTGGVLSVNSSLNGLMYFSPDTTTFNSNPVNLLLTQPLFQFNQFKWDRKIQPLKYSEAKQKFLEDVEQISITATNYFFNLLIAQVRRNMAMVNLDYYDTVYRIAEGRFQVGKIAENDLLLLQLSDLQARADLENAKLALEDALFQFRSYLRIKNTDPITLIPPSDVRFFTVNPEDAINLAKTSSPTYMEYQRRLLEAAMDVNRAKLEGRFDATITAGLGYTGRAPTVPEAYNNLSNSQLAGLSLTIPIYDWGVSRGAIKKAESQQEIVRNAVEQEKIDFERNIYLKVAQFNMQEIQVTIAAKADTVARKNFEVTKGRYMIGKLSDILVLNNAQLQTDNSRMGYYNALMVYWRTYFDLRKQTLFDFQRKQPLQFNISDIGL
jgi:outer membrane protein TolC